MKIGVIRLLLLIFLNYVNVFGRFSSKSPYIFDNLTNHMKTPVGYEVVRIWGMFRHGTRYPGKKIIAKYNQLPNLRDQMLTNGKFLNIQQVEAFKKWSPLEIPLNEEKFLTKTGEQELLGIGSRMRSNFPEILTQSSSKFTFKHTPTQRAEQSAVKFIEGLLSKSSETKSFEVVKDDAILRPYKGCQSWRINVKKNEKVSLEEKRLMRESHHSLELVEQIKNLTGIEAITIQDLEAIYQLCGFETSWQHRLYEGRSIWCSLFSEENLKVLEYIRDLHYYHIDGPAYEITRKVCCNTVDDMLNRLHPDSNQTPFTFYFSHSGTILKLLTFLEFFNDQNRLTAEGFSKPGIDDRKWKTSLIDKFSSNLIAVLYKSSESQEYFIQFFHQEKTVKIPGCQVNEHGMCSHKNFELFYREKTNNCNLQQLCRLKDEF